QVHNVQHLALYPAHCTAEQVQNSTRWWLRLNLSSSQTANSLRSGRYLTFLPREINSLQSILGLLFSATTTNAAEPVCACPRCASARARSCLMSTRFNEFELSALAYPNGRIAVLLARYPHIGGDRKSTRLNSSHVKISYAV